MKLIAIAAAGLVTLTAPAVAQHRVVHERTVVETTRHAVPDRGHDRQVCTSRYRHHHKVRVCRTVHHR